MKKTFFSLLALCVSGLSAQAQWVQQPISFAPSSVPILIDAVDANTAWAVGTENQLGRTVNAGQTWTIANLPLIAGSEGVTSFSASNATTAWITVMGAFGPRIMKTTDAGQTWTTQGSGAVYNSPTSWPDLIYFFSSTEGVTIGDAVNSGGPLEMFRTIDGGVTWTPLTSSPAAQTDEYPMDTPPAVVGNNIWFMTTAGRVFHSPDKGLTWTAATVAPVTGSAPEPRTVAFRNAQNGMVCYLNTDNTSHLLYRTTDGGATWLPVTYGGPLHGIGLSAVPGTGSYVSTGADIDNNDQGSSVSRDNGQTWVALESTLNHINAEFLSPTVGWSGGFTGTVMQPTATMNRFNSTALATRTDAALQASLSVSPNPAVGGHFTLQASRGTSGAATVRVLDVAGRQVSQCQWAGTAPLALDLSAEPAGLYVLEVQGASGTARQKVVVQ